MDMWVLFIGLMVAYVALMMLHFRRYSEFMLLAFILVAAACFYIFMDAEGPRELDPDILETQRDKWQDSEVESR